MHKSHLNELTVSIGAPGQSELTKGNAFVTKQLIAYDFDSR